MEIAPIDLNMLQRYFHNLQEFFNLRLMRNDFILII